jgi:two-component system sensor histidine kinase SenX3
VEWAVTVEVAAGLVAGLIAGLLLPRLTGGRRAPRATRTGEARTGGFRWSWGRRAIGDDQEAGPPGIGRRTIDSLRAGVVVLDSDDVPVLVNPAARGMGLLRTGPTPGSICTR